MLGDVALLKDLVKAGVTDFEAPLKEADMAKGQMKGSTILMTAVMYSNPEVVRYLLDTIKVDPAPKDASYLPLNVACMLDRHHIVEAMLKNPATKQQINNRKNRQLMSPLACAAYFGGMRCFRVLIECGADTTAKNWAEWVFELCFLRTILNLTNAHNNLQRMRADQSGKLHADRSGHDVLCAWSQD